MGFVTAQNKGGGGGGGEYDTGIEGQSEDDSEREEWQNEASDLSSPKSTSSASKNYDCDSSGDEVDEMPECGEPASVVGPKKSGSTTGSYSSVLQEEGEEDDILRDIENGNHDVKLSPTDSESFTTSEQLTQRFVDVYFLEREHGDDDGA